MDNYIRVKGAKLHNLKNIDIDIPKNTLTVITGLSGSGKSSLAFDTIYAEGQRRYVESLSTYARQFLNLTEKPDVDSIEGLSPAISIDQKTAPRNPRSTVGTITEIYDYLRLLFAKVGTPHDPETGEALSKQTVSQMVNKIAAMPVGKKIMLLSPIVNGRKGEHAKVFEEIRKEGFVRVRVDGQMHTINKLPELDEKKAHTIEIVVDRIVIKDYSDIIEKDKDGNEVRSINPDRSRLADSVETACKFGNGNVNVVDFDTNEEISFSERYSSTKSNFSIPELEPRMFSFNSPHGACETCHGLGTKNLLDINLIFNKNLSIAQGGILPWASFGNSHNWYLALLEKVAEKYEFSTKVSINRLKPEIIQLILYGTDDVEYEIDTSSSSYNSNTFVTKFEGVIPNLERRYAESDSDFIRRKIAEYMIEKRCPACKGSRLRPLVNHIKLNDKSIIDVSKFSVKESIEFYDSLRLDESQKQIAKMILLEIQSRLRFLADVGLNYLTLDRPANTLSGGEAQRIRLATQIGSKLSGVLYVLDEPSIGLHQNDNEKLINTLKELRDLGNTVIVVEHDSDTMLNADYIIDIGPFAGEHGGQVIFKGTPEEILKDDKSTTGQYLSGKKSLPYSKNRRKGNGNFLEVIGASENNLQEIDVKFPLGKFVAVTGVSGSGKSTLVNSILLNAVCQDLNSRSKRVPGKHKEIKGLEHLDKVINIDQSPIGRTPRSNPATYTGVFNDIRKIFAEMPEAKLRGYKIGRFSFNVKGGRCEACQGDGVKKIEMHFLPDVYVKCETCNGKRYNRETLEIKYKGKTISDVLKLTVEDALQFFNAIPSIKTKLQTLHEVGLDYIQLGQAASTLSGGEAQRVKLATELAKRSTGKTLFVLDEPTTGLHFDDIAKLLEVLNKLVDKGNTVLVIEHNLDVVRACDHVIDIGLNGGDQGGQLLCTGTPEEVAKHPESHTAKWLKKML